MAATAVPSPAAAATYECGDKHVCLYGGHVGRAAFSARAAVPDLRTVGFNDPGAAPSGRPDSGWGADGELGSEDRPGPLPSRARRHCGHGPVASMTIRTRTSRAT